MAGDGTQRISHHKKILTKIFQHYAQEVEALLLLRHLPQVPFEQTERISSEAEYGRHPKLTLTGLIYPKKKPSAGRRTHSESSMYGQNRSTRIFEN